MDSCRAVDFLSPGEDMESRRRERGGISFCEPVGVSPVVILLKIHECYLLKIAFFIYLIA